MSLIDRKFMVDFHQSAGVIVDLLPEAKGSLGSIDFLDVPRSPPMLAGNIEPVSPAAIGQFIPFSKLSLVLLARCHWSEIIANRLHFINKKSPE
jgi:hypothetical protein